MSYEGYREFLTRSGRHLVVDCWDPDPVSKDDPIEYVNSVDQTNGEDSEDPGSMAAEKRLVQELDIWRSDHYGNRYAVKDPRYEPVGSQWKKVQAAPVKKQGVLNWMLGI